MEAAGIPIPSEEVQLPTVVEAERSVQGLERRLRALGDVNMLAIEQYDTVASRIADLIADGKLLRSRRDELSTIADQLEDEAKDPAPERIHPRQQQLQQGLRDPAANGQGILEARERR